MLCEVADERQQTLDLGDGPATAPERKPRVRRTFCPRCGRGPLTGGKCGWCGRRWTEDRLRTGDLPDNANRGAQMTEGELLEVALELENQSEKFILTDAGEYLSLVNAEAARQVGECDRGPNCGECPELHCYAAKWLAADPAARAAVAERTAAFWREELAKPEEQREAEFWGMFGFKEPPKPTVRFAGMDWVRLPRPEVTGNAS